MKKPKKGPVFDAIVNDIVIGKKAELLEKFSNPMIRNIIATANNAMWNWEECSYRAHQATLAPEDFWALVKFSRATLPNQTIPLRDVNKKLFHFFLPSSMSRLLHFIDTHLGGSIQAAWPELESPDDQKQYLISSLCDEAIASSEIEGAVVTRKEAKEMLLQNRKPRNSHERMVMNNYQTIQRLNQRRGEKLTPEMLLEIQRTLTDRTMNDPNDSGRFRTIEDKVNVWDEEDHQVLHVPPPAGEIPERIKRLCAFANAEQASDSGFIHPVIRAMLLHFWLAYDHPFVDGNGRTARALFYWSMLRCRYWLVEYLTISSIILQQTKQYARAFLNTELDDNDLTYFLVYHVNVIERSIKTFQEYLAQKIQEREKLARVLLPALFNHRQQAILLKAMKDPDTNFSYESHARAHQITVATARTDLLDLEKKGLLIGNRAGRRFRFMAVPNLEDRLRKISKK
jgi:Fic family protein